MSDEQMKVDICKLLGESKFPTSPENLPKDLLRLFPGPWSVSERGNGHVDLYDSTGEYIAHIYLWDKKECDELSKLLELSKVQP